MLAFLDRGETPAVLDHLSTRLIREHHIKTHVLLQAVVQADVNHRGRLQQP